MPADTTESVESSGTTPFVDALELFFFLAKRISSDWLKGILVLGKNYHNCLVVTSNPFLAIIVANMMTVLLILLVCH